MDKKYDDFYAVIMAGGGGTRLWPLSRKNHPKQTLKLIEGKSLFQLAIERLDGLFPPERILVVTVKEQAKILQDQVKNIPTENYLIEPLPRGTASVVGYAAIILEQKKVDAVMAVLTADHIIQNNDLFRQLLINAYNLAQNDYLVTLGITPAYPSPAYGYINAEETISNEESFFARKVKKFVEKPDEKTAEEYLSSGLYFWNSGMFIWKVDNILREFERQMPVLYSSLEVIKYNFGSDDFFPFLEKEWPKIAPQTIDYGIMENANNVVVLPAEGLRWSDVGSWDSFYDFLEIDDSGNVILSKENIIIDSENCLLMQNQPGKLVVLCGINDLVVVDTPDALLITPKDSSQKVREVVKLLGQKEMDRYL